MKVLPNYRMDTKLKEEYMTSDPEWSKFILHEPVIPLLGSLKQIYDFMKRYVLLSLAIFEKENY